MSLDPSEPLPPIPPLPPFPPAPIRITGQGLVLRQWVADDLPAMIAAFDNPEVDRWTGLPSPFDGAAARERLARYAVDQAAGQRLCLAITEPGRDVPMGEVLLFRDHARATGGEIGYSVGRAFRGRGFASRSVRLLTGFAYDVVGMDRLVLRIDPGNAASEAVAAATGYAPDGAEPAATTTKGRDHLLVTWVHGTS